LSAFQSGETGVFARAQGVSDASPAPVYLGSAAHFAIIAGSTITATTTAGTIITGESGATTDIGVYPGSAVLGFPPATVTGNIHSANPTSLLALADLTIAYNDAAARSVDAISVAGNLGGMTYGPGLYKSTGSLEISSGDLTLDGQGNANAVWIFQMASTFLVTSGRQVILSGGAQAKNVFWQVGTSATLGSTCVVQGTIMADQAITLVTGAVLNGRALARIAAVSLDSNIITMPGQTGGHSTLNFIGITGTSATIFVPADTRIGVSNIIFSSSACSGSCLVCTQGQFISNGACSDCQGGSTYACSGSRTGTACGGTGSVDTQTCDESGTGAPPAGPSSNGLLKPEKIVIGVVVGIIGLALLIAAVLCLRRRRYAKIASTNPTPRASVDASTPSIASSPAHQAEDSVV
jgi:hypothetical protein